MTPKQIKTSRLQLGLSVKEAAELFEMDEGDIKRVERSEEFSTHRKPPVRFIKLLNAYLNAYRRSNWPQ